MRQAKPKADQAERNGAEAEARQSHDEYPASNIRNSNEPDAAASASNADRAARSSAASLQYSTDADIRRAAAERRPGRGRADGGGNERYKPAATSGEPRYGIGGRRAGDLRNSLMRLARGAISDSSLSPGAAISKCLRPYQAKMPKLNRRVAAR